MHSTNRCRCAQVRSPCNLFDGACIPWLDRFPSCQSCVPLTSYHLLSGVFSGSRGRNQSHSRLALVAEFGHLGHLTGLSQGDKPTKRGRTKIGRGVLLRKKQWSKERSGRRSMPSQSYFSIASIEMSLILLPITSSTRLSPLYMGVFSDSLMLATPNSDQEKKRKKNERYIQLHPSQ